MIRDELSQHTFTELRQLLGFGPKRLKLLLFLAQHPELDEQGWYGDLRANVDGSGSVKAAVHPGLREVRQEES